MWYFTRHGMDCDCGWWSIPLWEPGRPNLGGLLRHEGLGIEERLMFEGTQLRCSSLIFCDGG